MVEPALNASLHNSDGDSEVRKEELRFMLFDLSVLYCHASQIIVEFHYGKT